MKKFRVDAVYNRCSGDHQFKVLLVVAVSISVKGLFLSWNCRGIALSAHQQAVTGICGLIAEMMSSVSSNVLVYIGPRGRTEKQAAG